MMVRLQTLASPAKGSGMPCLVGQTPIKSPDIKKQRTEAPWISNLANKFDEAAKDSLIFPEPDVEKVNASMVA